MLIKMFLGTVLAIAAIVGVSTIAQHTIKHVQAMNQYRVEISDLAGSHALSDPRKAARLNKLVDGLGKEAISISRPPLPRSGGKWVSLGCYNTGCANTATDQNGGAQ